MNERQLQAEAKLFKGFGDPSRLSILEAILDKPLTVSEIVTETKLSQPNASIHLACLLDCGLVKKEKDGRNVSYQLSGDEAKKVIKAARKIISQHSKEMFDCTRY
jgi:DNA-binding transcriptional ArsR family regulator